VFSVISALHHVTLSVDGTCFVLVPVKAALEKNRRGQEGRGVHSPKIFLAYLVVLCFERRCPKQNTVARLKSKYLAPKVLGWLCYCSGPAAIANKVCSDSTRNEQVKTSVCNINFDGSSANVTLFSSQKILLFWKAFGWLLVICILTKACSFASWQILTYILIFCQKLYDIEKNDKR